LVSLHRIVWVIYAGKAGRAGLPASG